MKEIDNRLLEAILNDIKEYEARCRECKGRHLDIISLKHVIEQYQPSKSYYDDYLHFAESILSRRQMLLHLELGTQYHTELELRLTAGVYILEVDGDYFFVLEDDAAKHFLSAAAEDLGCRIGKLLVYTLDTCAPAIMDLQKFNLPKLNNLLISRESLENTLVRNPCYEGYVAYYSRHQHHQLFQNQAPIHYFLPHHIERQGELEKATEKYRPLWGGLCKVPEDEWPEILTRFAEAAWAYHPYDILWNQNYLEKSEYNRKKRKWCFAVAYTYLLHQKYPELKDVTKLKNDVGMHLLKNCLDQIVKSGGVTTNYAGNAGMDDDVYDTYYCYYEIADIFKMVQQDPYSILSAPDSKVGG